MGSVNVDSQGWMPSAFVWRQITENMDLSLENVKFDRLVINYDHFKLFNVNERSLFFPI